MCVCVYVYNLYYPMYYFMYKIICAHIRLFIYCVYFIYASTLLLLFLWRILFNMITFQTLG